MARPGVYRLSCFSGAPRQWVWPVHAWFSMILCTGQLLTDSFCSLPFLFAIQILGSRIWDTLELFSRQVQGQAPLRWQRNFPAGNFNLEYIQSPRAILSLPWCAKCPFVEHKWHRAIREGRTLSTAGTFLPGPNSHKVCPGRQHVYEQFLLS